MNPSRHLPESIPTPALVLDVDALQANLRGMQAWADEHGIALRPHAKTHKSPWVAARQVALGAVGICVTKLGEAEVMVHAGIRDVLITCPVPRAKVERLLDLAQLGDLTVVVDDPDAVAHLAEACARRGLVLPVLVDVDVGQGRTGVRGTVRARELAERCASSPALRFRGVQGYGGHLQHVRDRAARAAAASAVHARLREVVGDLRAHGLPVEVVSGDGTGTRPFAPLSDVVTEVQPGSYAVMDQHYSSVEGLDHLPALHVLTQVVSRPEPGMAVVDAGWKAVSTEDGVPGVAHSPGATFEIAGDEHGIVRSPDGPIDQFLRLTPSHCDTTVNLYDVYHLVSGGRPIGTLPVAARGAVT